MKKNRKITKKRSVVVGTTLHVGAILFALFVMVIVNILASSSCQQLSKAIGEKEKALERLEDARMRAATNWEEMKTPEKIQRALLRQGLSMKPPRPEQNIRMRADGTPCPGLGVKRAQERLARTASYSTRRRK